jgi:hypothetical protein
MWEDGIKNDAEEITCRLDSSLPALVITVTNLRVV